MSHPYHGCKVTVHYIGTLDNGKIFASTVDDVPLEFRIGENQVFPALEEVVLSMVVGETRNVAVLAADAYGPRLKENIIKLDRSCFPVDKQLMVGEKLNIEFAGGVNRIMLISEVGDNEVTLDGNHPLAGLDLTFALRLAGITP